MPFDNCNWESPIEEEDTHFWSSQNKIKTTVEPCVFLNTVRDHAVLLMSAGIAELAPGRGPLPAHGSAIDRRADSKSYRLRFDLWLKRFINQDQFPLRLAIPEFLNLLWIEINYWRTYWEKKLTKLKQQPPIEFIIHKTDLNFETERKIAEYMCTCCTLITSAFKRFWMYRTSANNGSQQINKFIHDSGAMSNSCLLCFSHQKIMYMLYSLKFPAA